MTWDDDATAAIVRGRAEQSALEAAVQNANDNTATLQATVNGQAQQIADLKAQLAALEGAGDPVDPTYFARDFIADQTPFKDPWHVLKGTDCAPANVDFVAEGLRLRCRNNIGAGVMLKMPLATGLWQVTSKISAATGGTTKVCLLLWPDKDATPGSWPATGEIDWNESGDRSKANQTYHYQANGGHQMKHTSYAVDQTIRHTYGVKVTKDTVTYYLDGAAQSVVQNYCPATQWNVHMRTTTANNGQSELIVAKLRISQ